LLSYEDADFFQAFASERCYRIKARGFKDEQWSYSNELCVPYDPLIFIPTAFSPNGDGLNDEFSAKCLGVKSYYLKIYNRWGEMVYQGLRWDGQYRGSSATQGIYIFYFEAMTTEGKLIYRSGTLTLLN
jgi:gliding motility-associated-like protein